MCADASVSVRCNDEYEKNNNVTKLITFMNKLYDIVDEIPPMKQPMRYTSNFINPISKFIIIIIKIWK